MGKRTLVSLGIAMVVFVGMGLFLWTNYYSAVADVREMFVDVGETDPYEHGATLFETRGCVFCHTLSDAGSTAAVGPVLDGIGARADVHYIRESIINPNSIIADNCGGSECESDIMPPYGSTLDNAQVDALVTYLAAQQ